MNWKKLQNILISMDFQKNNGDYIALGEVIDGHFYTIVINL